MRVIAIADLHGKLADLERIKGQLGKADLVIEVGDLTNFHPRKKAGEMLERLLGFNKNLLIVPGNCDRPEVIGLYEGAGAGLHGKGREVGGVGFFGAGGSNKTPFGTPIELEEHEIYELLTRGYEAVAGERMKVMVSHAPPKDTNADRLPNGAHVGSPAVREFIERHDLDLVLCAHIHEGRGSERLGRAEVLNVGPLHMGYAAVEMDGKRRKLSSALAGLPRP